MCIYLPNKCKNELNNFNFLSLEVTKYSKTMIRCHCLFAAVCEDISRVVINLNALYQWFPTFFHLCTPWQPISINCTHHISKMFVINIVAVGVCAFFHHYSIFFSHIPTCPGSYPWGTHTPGWESLLYTKKFLFTDFYGCN
jgi:hypothetical protein